MVNWKKTAIILPILAGVCWGCSGGFIRVLEDAGFPNVTIIGSRVITVVVLLGLIILLYDRSLFKVAPRNLPLLTLTGISGFLFLNYTYNAAIMSLSLSLATILLCCAPIFVILFSRVLFAEKITKRRVVCMFAVLLGCVLLSGVFETGRLQWSPFGLLMGAGSALCNAVCIMSMNEASGVRRIHPLTVQFYSALIAMIPLLFLTDFSMIGSFIQEAPAFNIPFLIAHALVASMLPNFLFNVSLRYVDAGVVAILEGGAEPASALILGLLAYHEVPTAFGLAGILIVVAALMTLSTEKKTS